MHDKFFIYKLPPPKAPAEKMKKIFLGLACGIAVLVCAAIVVGYSMSSPVQQLQSSPHIERTEIVDHVVDGDTIALQGEERVRLVGINTPEIGPVEQPHQIKR